MRRRWAPSPATTYVLALRLFALSLGTTVFVAVGAAVFAARSVALVLPLTSTLQVVVATSLLCSGAWLQQYTLRRHATRFLRAAHGSGNTVLLLLLVAAQTVAPIALHLELRTALLRRLVPRDELVRDIESVARNDLFAWRDLPISVGDFACGELDRNRVDPRDLEAQLAAYAVVERYRPARAPRTETIDWLNAESERGTDLARVAGRVNRGCCAGDPSQDESPFGCESSELGNYCDRAAGAVSLMSLSEHQEYVHADRLPSEEQTDPRIAMSRMVDLGTAHDLRSSYFQASSRWRHAFEYWSLLICALAALGLRVAAMQSFSGLLQRLLTPLAGLPFLAGAGTTFILFFSALPSGPTWPDIFQPPPSIFEDALQALMGCWLLATLSGLASSVALAILAGRRKVRSSLRDALLLFAVPGLLAVVHVTLATVVPMSLDLDGSECDMSMPGSYWAELAVILLYVAGVDRLLRRYESWPALR